MEVALAVGGIGLGIVLFIVASGHIDSLRITNFLGLPYESYGYPLPWLFQVGDISQPPTAIAFGLSVNGTVGWSAFYEDLAFWLVLPIAALELSGHVAVPYFMRMLKLRREKR
jgi:hypothetical protein